MIKKKAKQLENNYITSLLSNRKLILLLDIDNTILHAHYPNISEAQYLGLKKKYDYQFASIRVKGQRFFLKLRPYLKEMLEATKDLYSIYIVTAGTKDYAEEIITYINYSLEYNYLSKDRLVAREDIQSANGLMKSINKVLPSDENMVMILDDRIDVWGDIDNLINIMPFYFFREEKNKMNYIREIFLREDCDLCLYSVTHILRYVYHSFYLFYDRYKIVPDVRIFKKEKYRMIFKDVSIGYQEAQILEETDEFYVIKQFGGIVESDVSSNTSCVLTNYLEPNDYNDQLKEKYTVVDKSWVYFCNVFFCNLRYEEFKYGILLTNVYYSHYQILEANKDRIEKFYSYESVKEFVGEIKENFYR